MSAPGETPPTDLLTTLLQPLTGTQQQPPVDELSFLYPDQLDPDFVRKLITKTEFAETRSKPFDETSSPCDTQGDFEITPVQQFVATFLHPSTPYHGMLLYHGVGVGKTCAAIVTAEGYLAQFPNKKIILVAPPNIQAGFYQTIFDSRRVKIGRGDEPNQCTGCTGDSYLQLTNNLFTRDLEKIQRDVLRIIKKRYLFFGYIQFANYIRSIVQKVPDTVDPATKQSLITTALEREFSYRMVIIDEAHNLRDADGSKVDEEADTIDIEAGDAKGGKLLTPQLFRVLSSAEGLKLLLMTATPMFNDVREIVYLLNLLLRNDKVPDDSLLRIAQVLSPTGDLLPEGRQILGKYASRYISFMRGENPLSFPLRLKPFTGPTFTAATYPKMQLAKFGVLKRVPMEDVSGVTNLPLVGSALKGTSLAILPRLMDEMTQSGLGYTVLDGLVQAGNFVFPIPEEEDGSESSPEAFVGATGFEAAFSKAGPGGRVTTTVDAEWLGEDRIGEYSPKAETIIKSLRTCQGPAFVYSRFVKAGAFALALALEANGYTPWGRDQGFLQDGIQVPGGKQCALCPSKQVGHDDSVHGAFVPAKYILLTGDTELSPNNAAAIVAEQDPKNVDGSQIKVVLGSQIAAEGLNLKYIREIHVLDAWFHLNKTEQIVGRGIRFCSHSLLEDPAKRNTTVYLHCIYNPEKPMETADLYSYRLAYKKAKQVGVVSRVLKEFAVDCNLRRPATVLTFADERKVTNSKGESKNMNISDMPFTALCDWLPDCDYSCQPDIDIGDLLDTDDSTYTQFSAKFRESLLKRVLIMMFRKQTAWKVEDCINILSQQTGAPITGIEIVLRTIINNRLFRIKNGSVTGYIILKNGMFVFQPDAYSEGNLPAAVRIADFPIKKDSFTPAERARDEPLKPMEEVEKAEAPLEGEDGVAIGVGSFWSYLRSWAEAVSEGRIRGITGELEAAVERATEGSTKDKEKKLKDKLAMVVYFCGLEIDTAVKKPIILEYLWDNFLSQEEQRKTLEGSLDETMKAIGRESILQSGSVKALRFLNLRTGQIEYICEGGAPCSRAVSESFETDPDDPVRKARSDKAHAGNPYGFLAPKHGGTILFKTAEPVSAGEDIPLGLGCENVTNKKDKVERLVTVGRALGDAKLPNLGLERARLQQLEELKNGTRFCALLELSLRYADHMKVQSKRWFFRLVAAKYAGQKYKIGPAGRFAAAPAVPKVVAQKEKEITEVAEPDEAKPKTTKKRVLVRPPVEPS